MLRLKERHGSPYYYLRGTVRGISIDESTGIALSNKAAANDYRIKREAELLEESIHGKSVTTTFAQAALSYLESGGRKTFRLSDIIEHFNTTRLSAIGQEEIDEGAIEVFPNMQPASRRVHFYTPVSAILTHAAKRKWCSKIVFDWPSPNDSVERWLTKEAAWRLIDEGRHHRALLIFLFYTGARISEALRLDMSNLDLDRRHVQFVDTKNGTSRGVPLHTHVVDALREMLRHHGHNGGDVFRQRNGLEYSRDTHPTKLLEVWWTAAKKRADVNTFRLHDCRHTWATWHYQANRDLGALQKLGGWKTLAMVMRYAHTNVEELGSTIDRL